MGAANADDKSARSASEKARPRPQNPTTTTTKRAASPRSRVEPLPIKDDAKSSAPRHKRSSLAPLQEIRPRIGEAIEPRARKGGGASRDFADLGESAAQEMNPAHGGLGVRVPGFRSGFVSILGRPNVGKSTLLNALLGQEVALATARPQTTRERMLGVWTTRQFQAVLVDTPGIHSAKSALNRYMVDQATHALDEMDAVLVLAEAPALRDDLALEEWEPGAGAKGVIERLTGARCPVALVLTKCDRLVHEDHLLPIIERWMKVFPFDAVLPTSASSGRGLEAVADYLVEKLPEGPTLYDPDQLSVREMRWHAAELVRGELFARLGDELPYSCAVVIEQYRCEPQADRIVATIHVERDSQKGIVIGQRASMIKAISIGARARIAELAQRPVELFLEVRVSKDWTKDPVKMAQLGYRELADSAEAASRKR